MQVHHLFDLGKAISIHALREEGDAAAPMGCLCAKISIHALREEGDGKRPVRRLLCHISIHALREEGDCCRQAEKSAP